ncbi:MAG: HAD hydrolase-like protein [Hydrogenoanaerobacterium sp.]
MKDTQLILFDFDGTVFDTGEGITKGVAYALTHFGIEITDLSTLNPFIGPTLRESFKAHFNLNDDDITKAIGFYREYYQKSGLLQCHPYNGIEAMLRHLKAAGKTILLATSKPEYFAEKILIENKMLDCFDDITGATMDEKRTDKAEVIAYALKKHSDIPRKNMLMVGDTKYDVAGAKAEGVACVGVLYGYGKGRPELEEAGAEYIVADVSELEALLL